MKTRKPKASVTLDEVYNYYKNDLEGILTKSEYRTVTDKLFREVSEEILNGGVFHIGKDLGYICIKRFEKKFKFNENGNISNGMVNWVESKKLKQEIIDAGDELYNDVTKKGRKWLIYFDDKYNYRWAWIKNYSTCTIKNNKIYSFQPTNDNTMRKGQICKLGNKGKLKSLLKNNPYHYLKFIEDKTDYTERRRLKAEKKLQEERNKILSVIEIE